MSYPFHFFTSDISNFENWTEESHRLFLALFHYHLPNIADCLLADSWKGHLKHLFTRFKSSFTDNDYTNVLNLTSLSSSFIRRNGISTRIADINIHLETLQRLRKYRVIAPKQNALGLNFVDEGFKDVSGDTYFIDNQGFLLIRKGEPMVEDEVFHCTSPQDSSDCEMEITIAMRCKRHRSYSVESPSVNAKRSRLQAISLLDKMS